MRLGFTDHDARSASTGPCSRRKPACRRRRWRRARGLSVDNTEALGALSDAAITEADIEAGRFDGAEVEAWLVQWSDPANRVLQFRGSFGELERQAGGFSVELRGLAEAMNRAEGRVYQRGCSAVLGDGDCRFDLSTPGYAHEGAVTRVSERRLLEFDGLDTFRAALVRARAPVGAVGRGRGAGRRHQERPVRGRRAPGGAVGGLARGACPR